MLTKLLFYQNLCKIGIYVGIVFLESGLVFGKYVINNYNCHTFISISRLVESIFNIFSLFRMGPNSLYFLMIYTSSRFCSIFIWFLSSIHSYDFFLGWYSSALSNIISKVVQYTDNTLSLTPNILLGFNLNKNLSLLREFKTSHNLPVIGFGFSSFTFKFVDYFISAELNSQSSFYWLLGLLSAFFFKLRNSNLLDFFFFIPRELNNKNEFVKKINSTKSVYNFKRWILKFDFKVKLKGSLLNYNKSYFRKTLKFSFHEKVMLKLYFKNRKKIWYKRFRFKKFFKHKKYFKRRPPFKGKNPGFKGHKSWIPQVLNKVI